MVLHCDFYSPVLRRNTHINVILPTPGETGKKVQQDMKVLYLLHGLHGDETSWLHFSNIERYADEAGLAVVIPGVGNSFYQNMAHGEDFFTYVTEELYDFVQALFPVSKKREDTFIAGLSMGGYGAVINGLKYHETFSHIATLSGAVHLLEESMLDEMSRKHNFLGDIQEAAKTDKNPRVLLEKIQKLRATDPTVTFPKIYQTCGKEDFLYEANCLYREIFRSYGVDLTWDERPGKHDWDYWDETIQDVLAWLPLEEDSQGVTSGSIDA